MGSQLTININGGYIKEDIFYGNWNVEIILFNNSLIQDKI